MKRVGDAGLEPARLATPDPKSGLSANFSNRPLVGARRATVDEPTRTAGLPGSTATLSAVSLVGSSCPAWHPQYTARRGKMQAL